MPVLRAEVSEEEMSLLRAWKRRYAESLGKDPELVTWTDVLVAYANSQVRP